MDNTVFSVSDFVAVLNQTLEFAYPSVTIAGELANFRVSKNRWVYFDLKDELASVKFFGTVYQLPGPLEDGMTLQVRGQPRLHQLYGFSVNIQVIQPIGEGTIRRAAALLLAKLEAEGLFDPERKRPLPYAPTHIGLITSGESAAYADFVKILNARWGGVAVELADVQVQGEAAPLQIIQAIEYFNQAAHPPEVLVIIRGGGSPEDLAAFSTEQVTRAVAASRIPTLVAIGHEVDVSMAELVADIRASTPSNAAELLVPDKRQVAQHLVSSRLHLSQYISAVITDKRHELKTRLNHLQEELKQLFQYEKHRLQSRRQVLSAFNPEAVLNRGYAIVKDSSGKAIKSASKLKPAQAVTIRLKDGQAGAQITTVE